MVESESLVGRRAQPAQRRWVTSIAIVVAVSGLLGIATYKHHSRSSQLGTRNSGSTQRTGDGHRPVIAVMPKAKGDPYLASAHAPVQKKAARELNVDLILGRANQSRRFTAERAR